MGGGRHSPKAWGMRCRKASPSSPPAAKLSSSRSRARCWGALDSNGTRKRSRYGAALITSVAVIVWGGDIGGVKRLLGGDWVVIGGNGGVMGAWGGKWGR